jgi:hypothetical protein
MGILSLKCHHYYKQKEAFRHQTRMKSFCFSLLSIGNGYPFFEVSSQEGEVCSHNKSNTSSFDGYVS